ncbi:MAG: V-type ATP synthase subunit E [Christensenellales bacterium]
MADAQKLIDKILNDAKLDAKKHRQETERKKQELRDKTHRAVDKRVAEIERAADEAILENNKRIKAVYDLEHRKQILAAKQEVMARAKSLAMQKLCSLNKDDYLSLLKRRLLECAANGEGGIIVSGSETSIDSKFINDINGALVKRSGKGNISLLPEKHEMSGGFLYVNGGLEVDVSLEALLDEIWQKRETEIAAALFEEE